MLPFSIHFQPGLPPSEQLVDAVRKAVATGELKDGTLFPSVRTLSKELRLSPTTVHKAVAQLKSDGWLESRPGVGMQVRATAGAGLDDRLDLVRPLVRKLLREASELQISTSELLNLIRDETDPEASLLFPPTSKRPHHETRHPSQKRT